MSDEQHAEQLEAERRRGRAEGLRLAASLLRDGDLFVDALEVLHRIAEDEEPERERAGRAGVGR